MTLLRGSSIAALLALAFGGCVDNATRLRLQLEELDAGQAAYATSEAVVPYTPVRDNGRPYWLILLPADRFRVRDLIAAGLPEDLSIYLFQQLADVNFGDPNGPNIVVAQEGRRPAFTHTLQSWTDRAVAFHRTGPTKLRMGRRGGGWTVVGVD